MVQLVLDIVARSKDLQATLDALVDVLFQARLHRACLGCRLYAETGNPRSLRVPGGVVGRAGTRIAAGVQPVSTLLAIMETAAAAPNLEVRTVSERRGLDYVRAVRTRMKP